MRDLTDTLFFWGFVALGTALLVIREVDARRYNKKRRPRR